MLTEQSGGRQLIADALSLRLSRNESRTGGVNGVATEHQREPQLKSSRLSRNGSVPSPLGPQHDIAERRELPVSRSCRHGRDVLPRFQHRGLFGFGAECKSFRSDDYDIRQPDERQHAGEIALVMLEGRPAGEPAA